MNWQGKRYWLVGASDGLGAALARKLSARGVEVILSARSEDKLRALADELPGKASIQTVDIADSDSVKEAAKAVGRIDGLVLLAGVYWPFGAKDWDADQAVAMADINFTGFMTGFRGLPGSIGYTASKAATMSLAECMHADLRKTGVLVQVCNPGFIKTQLTDKNDFKMPMIMQPEEAAQHMVEHMETDRFKTSFPWLFSLVFRGSNFLPDWLYYRIFS